MTMRLTDMTGPELWEWYTEQPQDSESTLALLRDIVYRETVMEVTAKMNAKMEEVLGKLHGELS
jgi:hypothetical protein